MTTATANRFILVTTEFGYPLYVAPLNGGEIEVTDQAEDAEIFTTEDTLSAAKLPYYKAVTGYSKLSFVAV